MSVVTDKMHALLADPNWPEPEHPAIKVTLNTPVVAMSDIGSQINVTTTDPQTKKAKTTAYEMVFNTTAMAPLQRMDIQGLNLPENILTGIRTLSYDRATKVAIRFRTRWWSSFYVFPGEYGGVSSTDLPISNVVYPSWDDGDENPAVLMVSYSWAQDATRMGALVPDYTRVTPNRDEPFVRPNRDEPVVTVCLNALVKLFAAQPNAPSFDDLYHQYQTHHAFAWAHDQYTGGAFALFGPGQFKNVYPSFQANFCGHKFAMCGEALSAHHAWISGALDSAYMSVMRWLLGAGMELEQAHLKSSQFGGGRNVHPAEVDETLITWAAKLSTHRA
jgi:monoamine oxidase